MDWHDRIGSVLSQCLAAGFVYGPVSRRWRGGALVVGANWRPGRREPYRGVRDKRGSDPSSWPSPAAACSPFVEVVLRLLYDLRAPEWSCLSRSVTQGIERPGLREWTRDAHPRRYRAWDWDSLPSPLPSPLCLVLYRSHVVLLVDCDAVPVVHDGARLAGRWVVGADGTFADTIGVRRYSCQPLTVETAARRADRQRGRPDKTRCFRIVGLLRPDRLPDGAPRLEVA